MLLLIHLCYIVPTESNKRQTLGKKKGKKGRHNTLKLKKS
jgi:hypothetical protein